MSIEDTRNKNNIENSRLTSRILAVRIYTNKSIYTLTFRRSVFLLGSGLSSGLLSTRQDDYHNDLTISTSFTVDSSIIEEFCQTTLQVEKLKDVIFLFIE